MPELPLSDVQAAGKSYAQRMGFSVDWTYEDSFAGISRHNARVFLRRRIPEEAKERYGVLIWMNMASSVEVDQLHAEWKEGGVQIAEELRTTPYNLREFTAQDPDGNRFRVFYDMGRRGTQEPNNYRRRATLRIEGVAFMTTDWSKVQPTEHAGTSGVARWRTVEQGNLRVRLVEYSPGYAADHWCRRGHVLLVLEGS